MNAPSTTPHDAVFKQFLMHAETAHDFLDIHLPAELRELCGFSSLGARLQTTLALRLQLMSDLYHDFTSIKWFVYASRFIYM